MCIMQFILIPFLNVKVIFKEFNIVGSHELKNLFSFDCYALFIQFNEFI